ncbi:uncharacterized protein LOC132932036 isoform X1 [Rhopalosiphum padi]|uniref:uncharacterized protein LOC132932036 isoform X1 n=1 Tax=Rhopalosiphum padi TaxID=40932 RepID=UPI00298E4127|nr:uncharacterized protein LOC132932036 isoform X1 [Rhopalosiphum padi]
MIKCCEHIDKTDIDCNHFQLIGSSLDLAGRDSKIITLQYLNIYSYNRRGECDVRVNIIYNRNEQIESTVIQKIYFDTTVNKGMKCEFPDEDYLDYCNPINCHMKYSGYRGFFSTEKQKCVQIPTCQSKNNKDQAYIWFNNQCADLNYTITQKDIQEVLFRIENNKSDEQFRTFDEIHSTQKIRCHNGYLNSITDLCECDLGWENENNINWNDFLPSTIPLQMCMVRKQISKNFIQSLKFALIPKNWTYVELICALLISCVIITFIQLFIISSKPNYIKV